MSKRTRTSKIDKWLKEGRGTGFGADYKPWLNIQDVSSLGRSTRLKGIKTNRQHEFLSDLERNYFYLTEYSNFVVDIREQFPLLPLEETIVIADELGIKHPVDPKTNEPIVMTTDFLLTVDKGEGPVELARTIKMKDELLKERVIEKFEIERLILMYPQVIKHQVYEEQPFNKSQIIWLKIDCPYDGSLSTLYKSFFKVIDDLLGTRYLEKFGYLNRITSTMLLHMTLLSNMYGIGVLVSDEIQHLLHAKND